ncbi:MAG: phage major capsid protein [Clostridia bacterium]|nr:phage major capsid protein [Clostridia bacterium]
MNKKSLTELRDQLRTMQDEMDRLTDAGMRMADDPASTVEAMDKHRNQVKALRGRMQIVRDQIADLEENPPAKEKSRAGSKQARTLSEMRASNEYHRAFADAMRTGLNPAKNCPSDNMRVLYDALTISGGTTPGEDGGFLVPEDGDTTIRELMRDMGDIADLFEEENVSANSGWRVRDVAPEKGFSQLTGEAVEDAVAEDDQPGFVRMNFTIDTFGLNLPISRELLQDEDANLLAYIYRWLAKKLVITRSGMLLGAGMLGDLESQTITAATDYDVIKAIKKILNVDLDPMLSPQASMITNQDGYNYLDSLADLNGRPLLQPDLASGEMKVFGKRAIRVLPNRLLKTESNAAPLYVGAFKQYGTLFSRMPMEVASTDVGGNAWRSNSVEVRAIARMGVKSFDTEAAVKKLLTLPE